MFQQLLFQLQMISQLLQQLLLLQLLLLNFKFPIVNLEYTFLLGSSFY